MGESGGNDMNAAVLGNKTIQEIRALVPDIVQAIMNATRVSVISSKLSVFLTS